MACSLTSSPFKLHRTLYRRGFNRVASGGSLRRRYGGHWLDRVLTAPLFFLDEQTRLLIVKDFRSFRRDPAQWAQIILFLGMGSIYFLVMRRFYEGEIGRSFKIGISMLTLTATSFLMCAYTGRFIYPMLSLEGSKFWILGLLPLDRSRLLVGKFAFSAFGCVCAGETLIVFANLMLSMPWLVVVTHMVTIAILALAFSGLAVGMGALMPNFRETDPSKIAVGFGGTLNLVLGLLLQGAGDRAAGGADAISARPRSRYGGAVDVGAVVCLAGDGGRGIDRRGGGVVADASGDAELADAGVLTNAQG